MADSVIISSVEGAASLTISDPEFGSDGRMNFLVATLKADGVLAVKRIDAFMADPLETMFRDMAKHWKGWKGTMQARSIDGDLTLSAVSDSLGHAFLTATLRAQRELDWSVEVALKLESGQYQQFAQQLADFLAAKPGAV
jgi:hypothetical protein